MYHLIAKEFKTHGHTHTTPPNTQSLLLSSPHNGKMLLKLTSDLPLAQPCS